MATMLPVLDNSAVNTFAECPRKFYYQYVLHYQKPISAALHFGRVWHKMLDTWYTTGGDVIKSLNAGIAEWGTVNFPDDHRTFQRANEAFAKYVKQFGNKAEFESTYGYREGAPMVEIAVELKWHPLPLPYVGKIDRIVVTQSDEIFVNDHKTGSRMDQSYFRAFEMSSQMLGYKRLTAEMLGKHVAGVMVNAYNVTPTGKSDKFERQYIPLPDERVEHWSEVTLPAQMNEIIRCHEQDDWQQNHSACSGKYGLCHYFDVCSMPKKRRQSFLELNYEYRVWNPLAAD